MVDTSPNEARKALESRHWTLELVMIVTYPLQFHIEPVALLVQRVAGAVAGPEIQGRRLPNAQNVATKSI